jgi:hypothetical protein
VPLIVPLVKDWNLAPRSTALGAFSVTVPDVSVGLNGLAVVDPVVILTVVVCVPLLSVPSLTIDDTVRLGSAPELIGFLAA